MHNLTLDAGDSDILVPYYVNICLSFCDTGIKVTIHRP